MTNPLCERLRKAYMDIGQHYGYVACIDEAADEIERLRLALDQLADWPSDEAWIMRGFASEVLHRPSDEPEPVP